MAVFIRFRAVFGLNLDYFLLKFDFRWCLWQPLLSTFLSHITYCQTLYAQERDPLHVHIVVPAPSYTYNLYVVPHFTSVRSSFIRPKLRPTYANPLCVTRWLLFVGPIYVYVNRTRPTYTTYVDWTELRFSAPIEPYIRIYILIRTTYNSCLRPT